MISKTLVFGKLYYRLKWVRVDVIGPEHLAYRAVTLVTVLLQKFILIQQVVFC